MERLTKKNGNHIVFPSELVGVELTPDNSTMYSLLQRLSDYEDTGLSPEEVVKMGMMLEDSRRYSGRLELKLKAYADIGLTPQEVRELVHDTTGPLHKKLGEWITADKDTRLAILPCQVGTPIWWVEAFLEPNDRGRWVMKYRVKARKFDYSVLDWIDTPIYLAREEAEAALKGGGE